MRVRRSASSVWRCVADATAPPRGFVRTATSARPLTEHGLWLDERLKAWATASEMHNTDRTAARRLLVAKTCTSATLVSVVPVLATVSCGAETGPVASTMVSLSAGVMDALGAGGVIGAAITCIVLAEPTLGGLFVRGLNRVAGTFAGFAAAYGGAHVALAGAPVVAPCAASAALMFAGTAVPLAVLHVRSAPVHWHYGLVLASVTFAMQTIAFMHYGLGDEAVVRPLAIVFGVAIALPLQLVAPRFAARELRAGTAENLRLCAQILCLSAAQLCELAFGMAQGEGVGEDSVVSAGLALESSQVRADHRPFAHAPPCAHPFICWFQLPLD